MMEKVKPEDIKKKEEIGKGKEYESKKASVWSMWFDLRLFDPRNLLRVTLIPNGLSPTMYIILHFVSKVFYSNRRPMKQLNSWQHRRLFRVTLQMPKDTEKAESGT